MSWTNTLLRSISSQLQASWRMAWHKDFNNCLFYIYIYIIIIYMMYIVVRWQGCWLSRHWKRKWSMSWMKKRSPRFALCCQTWCFSFPFSASWIVATGLFWITWLKRLIFPQRQKKISISNHKLGTNSIQTAIASMRTLPRGQYLQ